MESSTSHEDMLAAFPYPPYDIQRNLMINIYEAIENKQIGLFESPTGTGKTLSVICSTLKWLEDERRAREAAAAQAAEEDTGLPDWMRSFGSNAKAAQSDQQQAQAIRPVKQQQKQKVRLKQQQVIDEDGQDLSEFLVADSEAPAAAVYSAATTGATGSKRTAAESGLSSSSSDEDEAAEAEQPEGEAAALAAPAACKRPQIIFCSRTHSQLSQFVGELHRTRYADSIMLVAVGSRKTLCVNDEVLKQRELSQINERCLELQRNKTSSSSGRKASARNPSAAAAGRDGSNQGVVGFMQQPLRQRGSSSGSKSSTRSKSVGCPYLAVEGGGAGWEDFTDLLLAAPIDVEELANLGRKRKVCPYYGSRRAVPAVDVVLAPYSAVLLPEARESLGIQLHDAVVVFDEAHNLLDAINGAHSTAVTAWQLLSVQRSLTAYHERFKSYLNPTNAQNVQQLLRIAAALHKCLSQAAEQQQQGSGSRLGPSLSSTAAAAAAGRVVSVNDLLFDLSLDNVNMFQLARWVKDNKMAFKVSGYTAVAVARASGEVELQQKHKRPPKHKQPAAPAAPAAVGAQGAGGDIDAEAGSQQQQQQLGRLSVHDGVSAIHGFVSFLLSLTNSDADGRIIIEPATSTTPAAVAAADVADPTAVATRGGRLRYVLLNAAGHFGRLLCAARSVLLVSGTLAPLAGLQAQLFPDTPPQRLRHFECGHVVPPDQLLTLSVGRGPSGRALNLRHEARGDSAVIDELGQLLLNLAAVVPEGLVVFVPSFGYLEQLVGRWAVSGLLPRLGQRKQLFREPRAATEVEQVLAAYAAAACGSKGSSTAGLAAAAPAGPDTSSAAPDAAAAGSASGGGSVSGSSGGGALMLCVVGGKLAEGINFGDGLGRCVVMLGMPYPNPCDPELRERMAYLDKQAAAGAAGAPAKQTQLLGQLEQHNQQQELPLLQQQQQQQQQQAPPVAPAVHQRKSAFQLVSSSKKPQQAAAIPTPPTPSPLSQLPAAPTANIGAAINTRSSSSEEQQQQQQQLLTGCDYYDDLCFKAVNQCVGRVVRHKHDYAAVVLVDSRWVVGPAEWAAATAAGQQQAGSGASKGLPVQKLPGWVQRSYVPTSGEFGQAFKQLAQFFKRRQQQLQQE